MIFRKVQVADWSPFLRELFIRFTYFGLIVILVIFHLGFRVGPRFLVIAYLLLFECSPLGKDQLVRLTICSLRYIYL